MVVGGHGRKGPKADETVMGSAIQYLASDLRFPCLIIKERKGRVEKHDQAFRFAVCFDMSDKAKKVLDVTLSMMSANDKLFSVTVKETGLAELELIAQYVKQTAKKAGITNVEIVFVEKQQGVRTADALEEYIQANCSDITKHGYVDFFGVGN